MGLRPGISPLAGAVLFIAVVMTAAAMLTGWIFTMDLAGSGEQVVQEPQCQYGAIGIFDATYSRSTGMLTVQVVNEGTIRLSNVTVTAFQQGDPQAQSLITGLNRGGLRTTSMAVPARPNLVHAASITCPGVTADTAAIDTAG